MPLSTTCPSCHATYTLADTMRGKKVRCKSCSEAFVVRGKAGSLDKDDGAGRIQVSPHPAKRAARYEEDEDTRRPQPRRRPREKSGNNILVPLLIVGGLIAVFLVLGAAGVAVWAFTRSPKTLATPVAVSSNPPANAPQPVQNPPQHQPAVPPPQMAPPVNPPVQAPMPVNAPLQPPMPANGPLAAELSNGNISGFGAQMRVTVNYRFTSGNPAGRQLFLLIKASKAMGLRQNFYLAELRTIGGQMQGTIGAEGLTFGIEHGPFEMWFGEGQPGIGLPTTESQIRKISNVVIVATKQFAPPGMGPRRGPPGMRR
ncbi:MAG TPA: zinc-ribbon domain-containing protein [Gemmataceae bacterium]|nr:zinc-ribbon domain-containing protein [Gemmataceae bacterium]